MNLIESMPDREKITRYFEDGQIYVGWSDTKEALVFIGGNTPRNREIGDVIARALRGGDDKAESERLKAELVETRTDKPTCGDLYLKGLNQWATKTEQRAFAIGFVTGQAEKVYLGVCPAAMFRPSPENVEWLYPYIQDVCERYDLRHAVHDNEIWIFRPTGPVIGIWEAYERDSPEWHIARAMACGIPRDWVDPEFHLRKGYNQPCDRV